jgi:hypothetical protein
MSGWLFFCGIATAVFGLPGVYLSIRGPERISGGTASSSRPPFSPIKVFREADPGARTGAVCALIGFGFAVATAVLSAYGSGDRITASQAVICSYILSVVHRNLGHRGHRRGFHPGQQRRNVDTRSAHRMAKMART